MDHLDLPALVSVLPDNLRNLKLSPESEFPDNIVKKVLRYVEEKSDRDACSLVCRQWCRLERASRHTMRFGALGDADQLVRLIVSRFTGLRNVYIDEQFLPLIFLQPLQLCKRKRNAEPHSSTDNPVDEDNESKQYRMSDAGLALLAKSCRGLEKLSVMSCLNITCSGLTTIAENCKMLRSMDIQGCFAGDVGLVALGQNCKQLEELSIAYCDHITDEGLASFAETCGNSLRSLSIISCTCITDTALQAVASHCKFLESLTLDSDGIRNAGLILIAQNCGSLKVLKLQCAYVSDEALLAIGAYCSSLEHLSLFCFWQIADRSILAIGNGCKKLRNLTLINHRLLSDQTLQAVAHACVGLTNLRIHWCRNIGTSGLECIGRLCPGLLSLSLNCSKIGNGALTEVGKGCSLLQSLDLNCWCPCINDDDLCTLAQGCKNLRKLRIRRCYKGGDKGIVSVGQNCKLLTDLSLCICGVGDEGLASVAEGCSLESLRVSNCPLITDAGITAVARCCPALVNLEITCQESVGDVALAELARGCPLLKDVNLHRVQITDAGLSHLVAGCTRLQTCDVCSCHHVTDSGIAAIVSNRTSIKRVRVEKGKVSHRTMQMGKASSVLIQSHIVTGYEESRMLNSRFLK